jgi:CTP:molybdopterin cytidylyltransferase MocA
MKMASMMTTITTALITATVIHPESDRTAVTTVGRVVGILLAAGAGRRAGGPKALRTDADGTSWLLRSIAVLRDGGCDAVFVVLGSQADRARAVITSAALNKNPAIAIVDAPDWEQGMGSSLRTGLLAAQSASWRAALVHLVDLPDVTAEVVRRLIRQAPPGAKTLARATYGGRPGHPVLIGRDHLESIMVGLAGDSGAKDYLVRHRAHSVECGDLASGQDRDT